MSGRYGVAGRLAAAFVHSKLTPLIIVASLLLGVYAGVALPREEEPQIIVPMVDVFVDLPGASPSEVEQRATRPLEKLLWEDDPLTASVDEIESANANASGNARRRDSRDIGPYQLPRSTS